MSVPPTRAPALLDALGHLRESTPDSEDDLARLARDLAAEAPVVEGPAPLLREVLLVAIDEAGEAVGESCTALLRGEGTSADARAAVAELEELLGLLETVERQS